MHAFHLACDLSASVHPTSVHRRSSLRRLSAWTAGADASGGCRDDSLVTSGIFAESFQIIRSEALAEEGAAAAETAGQLTAVRAVQVALDAGQPIPDGATAHDVAATMLSYFKTLPRPFFPESISTVSPRTSATAMQWILLDTQFCWMPAAVTYGASVPTTRCLKACVQTFVWLGLPKLPTTSVCRAAAKRCLC